MNIPHIPPIFVPGSGRGRGRGRGRGGRGGLPSRSQRTPNEIIQGTDTDAAVSRMSAVELGYFMDPFAEHFVPPEVRTRRLPIINRGTYVRTVGIDSLVEKWCESMSTYNEDGKFDKIPAQIISLGAGTDTRPLRMFSGLSPAPFPKPGSKSKGSASSSSDIVVRPPQPSARGPRTSHGLAYHEIDFKEIMDDKAQLINQTRALADALPNPGMSLQSGLESGGKSGGRRRSTYRNGYPGGSQLLLHGLDLRELTDEEDAPILLGLAPDKPTLLISECCLCYLEAQEAASVIKYFKDRIPHLSIILYEPVMPYDAFGHQMKQNLATRGIRMPTLEVFETPVDQMGRLRSAGFTKVGAMSIDKIWDTWEPNLDVDPLDSNAKERERVNRIEVLDEIEEWKLLASHYVIAYGYPGESEEMRSGWGFTHHRELGTF